MKIVKNKSFLLLSIGSFLSAGLGLLLTMISSRFLSKKDFADYSYFISILTTLSTITSLGYEQALNKEYFVEKDTSKLLINTLLFPLIFTLTLFTIFLFCYPLIKFSFSFIIIFCMLLYIIFTNSTGVIINFFRINGDALYFSVSTNLGKLFTTAFFLFTYFFFPPIEKYKAIFVTTFSSFLGIIISFLMLKKYLSFKNYMFDSVLNTRMLKFGLPLIPASFLMNFIPLLILTFLRSFASKEEQGIFSASLKIAGLFAVLQSIFSVVWIPLSYKISLQENREKILNNFFYKALYIVILFQLLVTLFRSSFPLFLGDGYADSQKIIPILAVQYSLYCLSEIFIISIYSNRKTIYSFYTALITCFTAVITGFFLIKRFSITGAAITIAVTYVSFFLARFFFSKKIWKSVIDFKILIFIPIILILSISPFFAVQIRIIIYIITIISLLTKVRIFFNNDIVNQQTRIL